MYIFSNKIRLLSVNVSCNRLYAYNTYGADDEKETHAIKKIAYVRN